MNPADIELLRRVLGWLRDGAEVHLFTVTATWGSAPRPVGSLFAVRSDGQAVGSVSGGCIEDDLIRRTMKGEFTGRPVERLRYGVTAEAAQRFGLPCGGTVELVRERLGVAPDPGSGREGGIPAVLAAIERRELVIREVDLLSGAVSVRPATRDEPLSAQVARMVTVHGPRWRLLLIGAGQLSRFVAQFALALGDEVIVCDPRDAYDTVWRDLPAVIRSHAMPDDCVRALAPDRRTAVIALSHDPKLDDLALIEALRSEAYYVGALGARKNNASRRERLREFDLTDAQLARLHGPVGLAIGAEGTAEIAVSIIAHLVSERRLCPQHVR
jgi:xanthine dehydrogenase accessory factor